MASMSDGMSGRRQASGPWRALVVVVVALLLGGVIMVTSPGPGEAAERPLLRLGSTGPAVTELEQRLNELGFEPGTIDQTFDTTTRNAVLQLQAAAGIARDGIVGPITWGVLDAGNITAPTTPPPPPTTPTPTTRPLLRQGSTGPAVTELEQRLNDLSYWVGTIDQSFDSRTHHAVVALQKAAGIGRDGIVGPITWGAVDRGARPEARTESGHLIEIDLSRQLLLVVDDGAITQVHDTSTGRTPGATPVGTFSITREIDGYRYAPLGTLYRPKYFYGGVAIHGYTSVPAWPASHGCVRLTYESMDHVWSTGVAPVGTTVSVYR
jgi:peptidoglycan hydrolase-like protein with peptidoglycan-binding domain